MTLLLVEDDNGIVVTGTVKDDGTGRDLTGATVAVILKTDTATHTITATADGDQVTNPGKFTATLTSTHLADADGKATLEVQVTDGSSVFTYPAERAEPVKIRADLS